MLSAASLDGQILQNCYRIEKRVGKGGMAWVYKAHHTVLNVPVAIKILLPSLAEEKDIRQRFIMEARVMFQLQHPHIVQVTDIIQEGDLIGMVMEWVDGEDLNQWLKRQTAQISWKQFWKLCSPMLGAMDYIHRKGFVHRDLKLSNIMLHYDGDEPVLKVADFGLVKVLDGTAEEHLTQTGTRMGTVAYMSPEQIVEAKSVGPASDIYSLGVVLYKLLTRKLPFTGDPHYVIYQHMDSIPPLMREYRDDIPPMVENVVMRSLSKKPEERWETCAEMAKAIRGALLESGCLEESQAEMFHTTADPDAAANTWHSTSPKRFSQWDNTQPEWMRERAYGSELHPSQSGLTVEDDSLASEMTQIGGVGIASNSKMLWIVVLVVLFSTVVGGAWWMKQRKKQPVSVQPRQRLTIGNQPQRRSRNHRVAPTPGRRVVERRTTPMPERRRLRPIRRLVRQHQSPVRQRKQRPAPPVRRRKQRPAPPVRRRKQRPAPRRHRQRLIRPVLMIKSSPQAEVWKGSRKLGKTPYRWKGKPGQTIHWTLKMRGYQPKSGRWRFSRVRFSRSHYQLNPQIVTLMIRSNPSGASVLIKGKNVGKTPYRYRGKQGSRVSFVLRKKGEYEDYKGTVRLSSNTKTKRFVLKPFLNNPLDLK